MSVLMKLRYCITLSPPTINQCVFLNYENIHEKININLKNSYNIQWSSANKDSLHAYKLEIRTELKKIKLPMNLLYCKDINCESTNCRTDIDYLCKSIINSLSNAAKKVFEQRVKTPECSYAVTGWNEYVAEAHTNARKAYKYWHDAGKPRGGSIAETMRKSRSIFKYALRFCKRNNIKQANILANKLLSKNRNDFWKEIKKIQNCTKSLSASINGITGDDNITELWKNHYKNIFSSVPSDNMNATYLNSLSDDDKFSFTCAEVTKAVDSFTAGKAADHSGISAATLEKFRRYNFSLFNTITQCVFKTWLHTKYINGLCHYSYFKRQKWKYIRYFKLQTYNCGVNNIKSFGKTTIKHYKQTCKYKEQSIRF